VKTTAHTVATTAHRRRIVVKAETARGGGLAASVAKKDIRDAPRTEFVAKHPHPPLF
jgi:hypothetical protein